MALSLQRYTYSSRDYHNALYRLLTERIKEEQEKSMLISIATKNGERLPENILIEILSMLPVKEVLQFKSVSKSWYDIISSPQFIFKHLKNNHNNNENCLLIQYHVSQGELLMYELLVDDTSRVLAYEKLYELPAYGADVCGPCDGLYYLCDYGFRALWNPAINELRTLPPIVTKPDPYVDASYSCLDFYGFGFHPVSKDYKVVVIKDYWSTNDESVSYPASVFVYSLRSDCWRYCGDLPREYSLKNNTCYIFVKGCCFWLGSNPHDDENRFEVIISFDMASDSFQEIPVPDYDRTDDKCLGMYDDSLAFFSVHEGVLDIWTLNHTLWIKKFTIGPILNVWGPVGHWQNNKVLLECEGWKLVLCDPRTQEIKDLAFEGPNRCEGIFAYMESLVSIKDKNKSSEDEQVEKGQGKV